MVDNVNGDIIIYQTDDGLTKIDVRVENETVWLSQQQMAELFGTSRTNIIEHINNIYAEEELDKESTCQNFRQVRKEGNRNVTREIPYYNLDMIISLGYRIKSKIATHFRRWATERLKEYMIKGFTMDDERLKGNGGGNYWKELLARIKDIKKNNDYAMWLQICKKADCYLLNETLAKYRRGREGSISTQSIKTMISWHYKLWHEIEEKNVMESICNTSLNLLFGFFKKLIYVKRRF